MILISKRWRKRFSVGDVLFVQFLRFHLDIWKNNICFMNFRFMMTLTALPGLDVMLVYILFILSVSHRSLKLLLERKDLFVLFSVAILISFFVFCLDADNDDMKRKRGGDKSSHKGDKINQWLESDMADAIQGFSVTYGYFANI